MRKYCLVRSNLSESASKSQRILLPSTYFIHSKLYCIMRVDLSRWRLCRSKSSFLHCETSLQRNGGQKFRKRLYVTAPHQRRCMQDDNNNMFTNLFPRTRAKWNNPLRPSIIAFLKTMGLAVATRTAPGPKLSFDHWGNSAVEKRSHLSDILDI